MLRKFKQGLLETFKFKVLKFQNCHKNEISSFITEKRNLVLHTLLANIQSNKMVFKVFINEF